MKKLISVLTAAVLAVSMLTPALAATPPFSDVSDPELSTQVDSLRMLGVVAGDTGGTFRPNSTLTRAEFCVMAVNAMGNANQVALYSTRTIFPDVRSDHWARGYINLAAAGMACTFVPEEGAKVCQHPGQLAYFAVDAPGFQWNLAAVYRKDTHLLHIARLFMDALKQQWQPEAAPGP